MGRFLARQDPRWKALLEEAENFGTDTIRQRDLETLAMKTSMEFDHVKIFQARNFMTTWTTSRVAQRRVQSCHAQPRMPSTCGAKWRIEADRAGQNT